MKTITFSLLFLAAICLTLNLAAAQNFWQQTKGPYGADVRSLAINSSGRIFAGLLVAVFCAQVKTAGAGLQSMDASA